MCAQYLVKANQSEISSQFEVQSSDDVPQQWSHYRVLPFRSAPIVCVKDGIRCLQEMRFHLTPKWSKTEKVKWATYNARLETIHEKASFKESFKKRRCLVLVSKFIEPVYEGEWAGHMVRFFDDNNGVLPAAGIYDEWINPESGEVIESFSIVTTKPSDAIVIAGHDRQPLFLKPSGWSEWLAPEPGAPKELKDVLLGHQMDLNVNVEIDRVLKAGWDKK